LLLDSGLVITRGKTKGNSFLVNPQVIANSKSNIKTSLKTIEPHRLMALIEEDLKFHPNSARSEVQKRLPDVDEKDIKKCLYKLTQSGQISTEGGKTYRRYKLANKKRIEKEN
jgi:ATP-dependent DNA helicase RecG